MKSFNYPLSVFALTIIFSSCSGDNKELLFNGENLEGWTIFVADPNMNPDDFFYVKDGMIETVGVPMGHLRTDKQYSNYKLHVEWRYPEKPTNSGVYLHTSGADPSIPNHFQAQLKYQDAGDFIVSGVGLTATVGDSVCTSTPDVRPLISKQHPTNEKPAGEWNSYDITCKGDVIELRVNGLLQNTATNCSVTSGSIGLQAEGSKIQFRNLWVESL